MKHIRVLGLVPFLFFMGKNRATEGFTAVDHQNFRHDQLGFVLLARRQSLVVLQAKKRGPGSAKARRGGGGGGGKKGFGSSSSTTSTSKKPAREHKSAQDVDIVAGMDALVRELDDAQGGGAVSGNANNPFGGVMMNPFGGGNPLFGGGGGGGGSGNNPFFGGGGGNNPLGGLLGGNDKLKQLKDFSRQPQGSRNHGQGAVSPIRA